MRHSLIIAFTLCLHGMQLSGQQSTSMERLTLRTGDMIRVQIWREGDLNGDFQVDPVGEVTLPLVGTTHVAGRPWLEVRDEILIAYRDELRNPSIIITPYRRVYVLGEVNEPGPYSVDPSISLAGAVAIAGGANPEGDLKKVRVVRDGETIVDEIPDESSLADIGVRSGDQIFIGRRGWLERNTNFLLTAGLSVTSILITLFTR